MFPRLRFRFRFVCFRFLRQGITDWTNINTAARRVDLQVGLKQRLSTIAAKITAGTPDVLPASRLWTFLLRDNIGRLPTWEVKKVGPSRVPWSLLPFLGAVILAFFIASIPLLSPASEPVPARADSSEPPVPGHSPRPEAGVAEEVDRPHRDPLGRPRPHRLHRAHDSTDGAGPEVGASRTPSRSLGRASPLRRGHG